MHETTENLQYKAIGLANKMYGELEDLKNALSEMARDSSLDDCTRISLLEYYVTLPEPELFDELLSRLCCIDDDEEKD